jgi:hypothetical protein
MQSNAEEKNAPLAAVVEKVQVDKVVPGKSPLDKVIAILEESRVVVLVVLGGCALSKLQTSHHGVTRTAHMTRFSTTAQIAESYEARLAHASLPWLMHNKSNVAVNLCADSVVRIVEDKTPWSVFTGHTREGLTMRLDESRTVEATDLHTMKEVVVCLAKAKNILCIDTRSANLLQSFTLDNDHPDPPVFKTFRRHRVRSEERSGTELVEKMAKKLEREQSNVAFQVSVYSDDGNRHCLAFSTAERLTASHF